MASQYNPLGLTDSCFFVTVAYLLGLRSVYLLPATLQTEMGKGGVFPLDSAIKPLLDMTGRPYRTQSLDIDTGTPNEGFEVTSTGGRAVWRLEQFLMSKWSCDKIGVGYVTKTGVHHFIVVTEAQPPTYMCYQHTTGGVDKWEEVKGDWRELVNEDRTRVVYAFGFVSECYDDGIGAEVPTYSAPSRYGLRPTYTTARRSTRWG